MSNDPSTARRLAFIVGKGKFAVPKKAVDVEMEPLPPSNNKYNLIGKERSAALLVHLSPSMEYDVLMTMTLKDLQVAVDYALALLPKSCALPSRIWGQLKQQAASVMNFSAAIDSKGW